MYARHPRQPRRSNGDRPHSYAHSCTVTVHIFALLGFTGFTVSRLGGSRGRALTRAASSTRTGDLRQHGGATSLLAAGDSRVFTWAPRSVHHPDGGQADSCIRTGVAQRAPARAALRHRRGGGGGRDDPARRKPATNPGHPGSAAPRQRGGGGERGGGTAESGVAARPPSRTRGGPDGADPGGHSSGERRWPRPSRERPAQPGSA